MPIEQERVRMADEEREQHDCDGPSFETPREHCETSRDVSDPGHACKTLQTRMYLAPWLVLTTDAVPSGNSSLRLRRLARTSTLRSDGEPGPRQFEDLLTSGMREEGHE